MAFEKRNTGLILLISFIGALIGTILSKLLVLIIPALGPIIKSLSVDLSINLNVLRAGMSFDIVSVIGVVVSLLIFRKI
ncbi:MAG: hypothetical protein KAR07_07825 [Spirochaetes bacterium]|nr:hypothetical protein [Spirochaetota bacterium]MCK5268059.1 hypothetical protein [Spirochaetota bacterium]